MQLRIRLNVSAFVGVSRVQPAWACLAIFSSLCCSSPSGLLKSRVSGRSSDRGVFAQREFSRVATAIAARRRDFPTFRIGIDLDSFLPICALPRFFLPSSVPLAPDFITASSVRSITLIAPHAVRGWQSSEEEQWLLDLFDLASSSSDTIEEQQFDTCAVSSDSCSSIGWFLPRPQPSLLSRSPSANVAVCSLPLNPCCSIEYLLRVQSVVIFDLNRLRLYKLLGIDTRRRLRLPHCDRAASRPTTVSSIGFRMV